jgi:nucleotide-binding universal stress UspA family protein
MHQFKHILVATDTRFDQHQMVDEAAKLAAHSGAKLMIVDVLPEFSWTVKMSMKDHEHVVELIAQEKSKALNQIAEKLGDRGLEISTQVLRGKTSVEIIRAVLRNSHDLVMRTTKGKDSQEAGFFGRTSTRLLRKCPCPVWLVRPDRPPVYQNIFACVDTSSGEKTDADLNDTIFQLAQEVSSYHKVSFALVHAWSIWNEQMLKSRMLAEKYEELRKDAEAQETRLLDLFADRHGWKGGADQLFLLKGEAGAVIADLAKRKQADLIVMGTVARSGLQGVLMGNSAERILDRVQCDVLAVKPTNFVCPVKLDG